MISKLKALPVIIIAVLATKVSIIWLHREETSYSPYAKVNQSRLQFVYDNEESFIIDKKVRVVNQVDHLKAKTSSVFVIILSAPRNVIQRHITRQTLRQVNSTLAWAFLIGQTTKEIQDELNKEMIAYGDILQFSIEDKYQNLAYKSLAAFAWLYDAFENLDWIIKLDDDLDLKLDKFLASLPAGQGNANAIYCPAVMRNMPPVRTPGGINGKLYVSPQEWPEEARKYPAYCNGYVYALKPKLAMHLSAISGQTPYLPLDDIYVTGVLRERLDHPKVRVELTSRFQMGNSLLDWMLNCPFLGVAYYALIQDMAYQRDYWPWGIGKEILCLISERYLGLYKCGAK